MTPKQRRDKHTRESRATQEQLKKIKTLEGRLGAAEARAKDATRARQIAEARLVEVQRDLITARNLAAAAVDLAHEDWHSPNVRGMALQGLRVVMQEIVRQGEPLEPQQGTPSKDTPL